MWDSQGDRETATPLRITPLNEGQDPLLIEFKVEQDIDNTVQPMFATHIGRFHAPDKIRQLATSNRDPSKYFDMNVHATPTSSTTCRFFMYSASTLTGNQSWFGKLKSSILEKTGIAHLSTHTQLDADTVLSRAGNRRLKGFQDDGKSWQAASCMPSSIDYTITGFRR